MMFEPYQIDHAVTKAIQSPSLPAVKEEYDVGKAIETGIIVLRGLDEVGGGFFGWLRKRNVRKAIRVLDAVNQALREPRR